MCSATFPPFLCAPPMDQSSSTALKQSSKVAQHCLLLLKPCTYHAVCSPCLDWEIHLFPACQKEMLLSFSPAQPPIRGSASCKARADLCLGLIAWYLLTPLGSTLVSAAGVLTFSLQQDEDLPEQSGALPLSHHPNLQWDPFCSTLAAVPV